MSSNIGLQLGRGFPITTAEPPLCWLPTNYRVRFLRMASKRWPMLFGSQHVLKAEML